MAYSIQPIETIYNGYRFRSRLEARWAVFFDAGRIKYEYEPNGYNLNGINYLPDFYLPDFDLFVEIKPFDKDVVRHVGDGNKWEKICSNFRNITGRAILLCYGYPHEGLNKMLYAHDLCDSGGGISDWKCRFVIYQDRIVLCTNPTRSDRSIYTRADFSHESSRVGTPYQFAGDRTLLWERTYDLYDPNDMEQTDLLSTAKRVSQQARFEHGEKPPTEKMTASQFKEYLKTKYKQ